MIPNTADSDRVGQVRWGGYLTESPITPNDHAPAECKLLVGTVNNSQKVAGHEAEMVHMARAQPGQNPPDGDDPATGRQIGRSGRVAITGAGAPFEPCSRAVDRKSTRLNSSHLGI